MSTGGFERPDPIDPGPGGGGGGFRVVGIVLVVLGLGMVLVCAGGAYWLSQNEAFREGFESIAASQNAPGAQELRDLGCDQAMILDPAVFFRMAAGFSEEFGELGEEAESEDFPSLFVICNTGSGATISCSQVAETYVGAVGRAEDSFMVQVASGGSDPCQEVYSADGSSLGGLADWSQEEGSDDF
ncbi:MAG: hypothetical protein CL910_21320 [Deltaproteobacteria bacterium]|jgi:hypothetical protein|nr:hypothetical protein [Deltaproteobacteria bacterium]